MKNSICIRSMFSLVLIEIDRINHFIFHPFNFTLHTVNTRTLSLMSDKDERERLIGTGGRESCVLIGKSSTTFLPLRDIPRSLSFAKEKNAVVNAPSVNLFMIRDSSAIFSKLTPVFYWISQTLICHMLTETG